MPILPLAKRGIATSRLILGCMPFGGGWNRDPITREHIAAAERAVDAAQAIGISMFDHADIYTMGKAEQVFGTILKSRPELRDRIVLQSKCGIRFGDGSFAAGHGACGRTDEADERRGNDDDETDHFPRGRGGP